MRDETVELHTYITTWAEKDMEIAPYPPAQEINYWQTWRVSFTDAYDMLGVLSTRGGGWIVLECNEPERYDADGVYHFP